MNIIEVIEAKRKAEAAKKAYYESFKMAIFSIVEETMKKIGYDESDNSYNYEVLTEEQSLYVSEEIFRLSQRKERKLKEILNECEEKLYNIIESINEESTAKVTLYNNNDIEVNVIIDEKSFEWLFENRYNR